jgi:hypothetical protein
MMLFLFRACRAGDGDLGLLSVNHGGALGRRCGRDGEKDNDRHRASPLPKASPPRF